MDDDGWLTDRFEAHRAHLRAVALRILGSAGDADDAVQESWLRLNRSDTAGVDNLGGWLTTVVSRVCLDMLRARKSRREDPIDAPVPEAQAADDGPGPEHEAMLADALGPALLVVLDTLEPAERLSFVPHDMFAVPFAEIATIIDRTPVAARQLASRARRWVQASGASGDGDRRRQRQLVDAFLAASREGDFTGTGVARRASGREVVRRSCARHSGGAAGREVGAVWAPGGRARAAFRFTVVDGRITGIEVVVDRSAVGRLDVQILGSGG